MGREFSRAHFFLGMVISPAIRINQRPRLDERNRLDFFSPRPLLPRRPGGSEEKHEVEIPTFHALSQLRGAFSKYLLSKISTPLKKKTVISLQRHKLSHAATLFLVYPRLPGCKRYLCRRYLLFHRIAHFSLDFAINRLVDAGCVIVARRRGRMEKL